MQDESGNFSFFGQMDLKIAYKDRIGQVYIQLMKQHVP